ncbi:hypothetical protein SUGI_0873120 [Cryptomeria japonica]|nr:hypothetical protein SUGI_0873120 [Cryptomeria japonica]
MATKSLVSFITLATLSLTIMICDPVNAANVFTVGDEKGWTLGFDYQAWAQDKQFHIGDRLVFNYPKGVHNVLVVNGSSFANCVKDPIFTRLESGHDVLEFMGTGNVCCTIFRRKLAYFFSIFRLSPKALKTWLLQRK